VLEMRMRVWCILQEEARWRRIKIAKQNEKKRKFTRSQKPASTFSLTVHCSLFAWNKKRTIRKHGMYDMI
jgi:hypothetical protein